MGSESRSHIVVVGAGVVGASIAWHLASHPSRPRVTVVAEHLGGTATPCSFAWLNASWHNPRFYYDFRRRSIARWRQLGDDLPELQKLLHWGGSLSLGMTPEDAAEFQKQHAAWGYDIHRVDRAEILALEPALAPDPDVVPAWGLRVGSQDEGAVEAHEAARVLVADAQARWGARLVSGAATRLLQQEEEEEGGQDEEGGRRKRRRVTGVLVRASNSSSSGSGDETKEKEEEEEIRADHVVLAAGAGCGALAATAGVTVPLSSLAGLLVRSKPMPQRLLSHVVYTPKGHLRQTADGRLLGGSDFAGGDPGPDPAAAAEAQFAALAASLAPELRPALALDSFTVGYRPTPADGLPVLGRAGGAVAGGLSLAVMHSGVTNAALVGELLAESILTGREDPALADFALARFGSKEAPPASSA